MGQVTVADAYHAWLASQRQKVPDGSATAKAIDYNLGRWVAPTRYVDDGDLPADNNWVENRIRPIAIGRSNWLFAGSLRAGKRAAAVMSLLHSVRLNAHGQNRQRLPARLQLAVGVSVSDSVIRAEKVPTGLVIEPVPASWMRRVPAEPGTILYVPAPFPGAPPTLAAV
jgi:hypothetical protein